MPFTFAHPAAVVPLLRPLGRHAVLSALVIGSIAPDFSYFLPVPMSRSRSHDVWGLFWFCMPLGAAAYALFHGFLAAPWIDLLPAGLRARCRVIAASRAKPALTAIVISLFVGAATHVAWDAFTHAGAPIVRVSRPLRFHLFTYSGYPVSVYTILQHASTAAGIVLLWVWIRRWHRRSDARAPEPGFAIGGAARAGAIVAVLAMALALWLASDRVKPMHEETLRGLQIWVRRAVPVAIAALTAALGIYAVAWQVAARVAANGPTSRDTLAIAARSVLFTFVVPGTVAGWVPLLLLRGATLADAGALRWLGVAPLVAGLVVYVWCVADFATVGRGTPAPIDPPKELVRRGLYGVTRNPMYVGVLAVLAGEAWLFASPLLALYAAFVFACFHLFVLFYEEPTLRRSFGDAYERYCAAVPRWLPLG
jgi:protein-S-isoprenylcysteine O-methyltransferase Ste14